MIKKRKKNPKSLSREEIVDHIVQNKYVEDFDFIREGTEAEIYYFLVTKNTYIFDALIKPGEYVLKRYKRLLTRNSKAINYLKTLSNYGLIPKIFYIDANVIIMKYIHGIDEMELIQKYGYDSMEYQIVQDKISKLEKIWQKLGFRNFDLSPGNILISDNLNVYIIDPFDPIYLPV